LTRQAKTRLLVRLHGETLGYVTIKGLEGAAELTAAFAAVNAELAEPLAAHLRAEEIELAGPLSPSNRPPAASSACPHPVVEHGPVSVVVCTRDRTEILESCLLRLPQLTYPNELEFIVVDNAPSNDRTEELVRTLAAEDNRFVYVREPFPGLSWARNRGLATARYPIVAFTDDDVTVDPNWVSGLARGFDRRSDVACVTGLVCTANITNRSEAYFDHRLASWWQRSTAELFDLTNGASRGPLYPYGAGIFGTGANFAIDRQFILDNGSFDVALGAGTCTRGGEDLDAFVRVLQAGRAIAYEPSALVWHHHRADDEALLKQMYGYGTGLSAYLTKLLLDRRTRADILRRIPSGFRRLRGLNETSSGADDPNHTPPPGVIKRERRGFVAGPYLYFRARRIAARLAAGTSG
jgi:glycosyltransferase involved in cell wall biosynthesis